MGTATVKVLAGGVWKGRTLRRVKGFTEGACSLFDLRDLQVNLPTEHSGVFCLSSFSWRTTPFPLSKQGKEDEPHVPGLCPGV